ncbi:hypothetical protein ACEWY4_004440 [Coilia grayii]|uniref:PLAT domain-containing protein n=1 Tax=Coilia grayii TaxID=363190 RepID=A0ABD1KLL9_9TELE
MPTKEKKRPSLGETEEPGDELKEKETKAKGKSKTVTYTTDGETDRETSRSHSEPAESKKKKKKKEKKESESEEKKKKQKKAKKKQKEEEEDEGEDVATEDEENNNEPRRKEKKKDKPVEEDEGVKEEKKKKKKSSKTEEKEEENMADEEDEKKKKKKKGKKGSEGDEDKKKKKKKNGPPEYAEIFQKQLLKYQAEDEDFEDEYYKKKVYEVVTVTGDIKGAGTDTNVFVTLFGENGITPKIHLSSKSGLSYMDIISRVALKVPDSGSPGWDRVDKRTRCAFEKNKTDVFRIKTHNVGTIVKIRIERDNTGTNKGWFVDRVVVADMAKPHQRLYFSCNAWLSTTEGDGMLFKDLLGSFSPMDVPKTNKYMVTVYTPDIKGSGTDADVFLSIFGEKGDSGTRKLFSKDRDCFERGSEDKFLVDAPNMGRIHRIMIGHNNKGCGSAGWILDKVLIDDIGNKEHYEFPYENAMFDLSEGDGRIQRDALFGHW